MIFLAELAFKSDRLLGYATFVIDANEISAEQPVSPVTQIPEKQVKSQK